MRTAIAFLLFIAFASVVVSAQREYIGDVAIPGFDIIFSNDTTFFDQLDHYEAGMYVAGQGRIFQINEYPEFNISYFPVFPNYHRFLDFKTFRDSNSYTWAIGSVANYNFGNNTVEYPGLNYPLAITGGDPAYPVEIVEPPPGFYMMSAVTVDESTDGKVIAYFSGWHQHMNASEGVNFTLIRTVVNTTNALASPPVLPVFEYDHTGGDRVYLHGEDYIAYSRDFKPWMFHSLKHYHLVIVDPATNNIFRVFTPLNLTEPISYNATTGRFRLGWFGGSITGATYDHNTGYVYVGIAGQGILPGTIIVVDVFTMTVVKNLTLGLYESNPKGLRLNTPYNSTVNATSLYVALYGGHAILNVDLATWIITSLSTLSPWLSNVYGLGMGVHHLYFITNEQHSKVGRVALTNFCPTLCDVFYGFCNNSVCQCWPAYMQANANGRCELTPTPTTAPTPTPTTSGTTASTITTATTTTTTTTGPQPPTASPKPTNTPTAAPVNWEDKDKKDKSGEIALGILFAIATIAAAAGWYLLWRSRGGGVYGSLINRS